MGWWIGGGWLWLFCLVVGWCVLLCVDGGVWMNECCWECNLVWCVLY